MRLGGMSIASAPDATTAPVAKLGRYPRSSISGTDMRPTTVTADRLTPDSAPKTVDEPTAVTPRPPGSRPSHAWANRKMARPRPPTARISPMRMYMGAATSA